MKTIGLLGGMSWESTLEYYRILNEETKKSMGKSHSAKILMYSFDFHEVEVLQSQGEWEALTDLMVEKAMDIKKARADFIVICTNTMHLMAPDIENATGLKVLHIADATAADIKKRDVKRVALLGTRFTMEGTFYKERLNAHGIEVMIPNDAERQIIHDIIYNELVLGEIKEESKRKYVDIISGLQQKGAQGVVLGCTEIPLLIKQGDVEIEVFDTTTLHAMAAVDEAVRA